MSTPLHVTSTHESGTAILESGVPTPLTTVDTTTTSTLPVAVESSVPSHGSAKTTASTSRRPSMVTSSSGRGSKSKKKKGQPAVTMATAPNQSGTGAQGENTGRWTAEEHRLFLAGLAAHGKGWKKIASLIKSRTVVQIRTHAQKYFQKLAKARQNGEEGDVTMEGRGGVASETAVSTPAQTNKRRRQITGTKRKAIQSVVASAQRQGKKMAAAQAAAGIPNPVPPFPAISPALAHFVLPNAPTEASGKSGCAPSINTSQGTISGPALEDSLFRFLTPCPVATADTPVNDVARQAGANPITVPSSNPSSAPASTSGEYSPTGVQDISLYPSWTDAKDPPSWYSKGGDVDALLDVADTLDWLADTGDANETYRPPVIEVDAPRIKQEVTVNNSTSVTTLPDVDSNVDSVVPPLPSLFEGDPAEDPSAKEVTIPLENEVVLHKSPSEPDMEHLEVFDTPMDEHDFVATILETTTESTDILPSLG